LRCTTIDLQHEQNVRGAVRGGSAPSGGDLN
jgi:hypothetical protein